MSRFEKFREILIALSMVLIGVAFVAECPFGRQIPLLSGQLAVISMAQLVVDLLPESVFSYERKPLASGYRVFQQSVDALQCFRNIPLNGPPYLIEIDLIILMDNHISHTRHFLPWNLRMFLADGFGNAFGSFADHREISFDRIPQHFVPFHIFFRMYMLDQKAHRHMHVLKGQSRILHRTIAD